MFEIVFEFFFSSSGSGMWKNCWLTEWETAIIDHCNSEFSASREKVPRLSSFGYTRDREPADPPLCNGG